MESHPADSLGRYAGDSLPLRGELCRPLNSVPVRPDRAVRAGGDDLPEETARTSEGSQTRRRGTGLR